MIKSIELINSQNVNIRKAILVDKSINASGTQFQANMSAGLLQAYKAAFLKVQNLFTYQNSRRSILTTLQFDPNQMQVNLVSSLPNGLTNADRSKNQVNLRYYLVDKISGQAISAELAADAINLLGVQELARILGQEVVQQGFVEAQPRVSSLGSDEKLWIIAAVLGPLAILFLVFWIIFCVYYKCINTQKRKMRSKSKARIINTESPNSVLHFPLLFE